MLGFDSTKMKIYTIEIDRKNYQKIEFLDDYDPTPYLPVSHEGRVRNWKPPACRLIDADKPAADFMLLSPNQIVFDPLQLDADFVPDDQGEDSIYKLAEMAAYGEVACVTTVTNQRYHILIVTECCNALDRNKSQWQTDEYGQPTVIEKFVFHEWRIGTYSGLFRLADPDFDRSYIFAYTAREDEEIKFIDRYFQYDMSGLLVTEVWSDEVV